MKTLIFPGYSAKNKVWAEEIGAKLDSEVVYWEHWQTGTSDTNWINIEAQKIISNLNSQVNILAHSAGTIVAMKVLGLEPKFVNKIILCGIPVHDFMPGDQESYQALKFSDAENILCIQNEDDNHGTYSEIKAIINTINPNIMILSKPASNHAYPYIQDFLDFFDKI